MQRQGRIHRRDRGQTVRPFRLPRPVVGVTVVVGLLSVPVSTDRQGNDEAEKLEGYEPP